MRHPTEAAGGRCPACSGAKHPRHYLCGPCWYTLQPVARRALSRRDEMAGVRLLQLHEQLADGIPLPEIEVTP